MDNYGAFQDNADLELATSEEAAIERPPEIGSDERRMQVRAYNYWVSLLDGRPYPKIEDLDPANIDDFGPNSVLLDFSGDSEDPAVHFIGRAVRAECGLGSEIKHISDVPSRSLLSRLTDHYLQIIANRAPIGFEAEFVSQAGHNTMYRGILMPFSLTGETIDFIYGVINWKEVADRRTSAEIAREVGRAASVPIVAANPIWADGPHSEPLSDLTLEHPSYGEGVLELGTHYEQDDEDQGTLDLTLDADAALADRLCVARETAEAVKSADARSRSALYRALGQAYDFAVAAEDAREDYAEILEDAGLKAQQRAPMTPIVKLVFGVGYDKTRLTEFAAALSWGRREAVPLGGFSEYLTGFNGGLKAIVQAERRVRRPDVAPAPKDDGRGVLRAAEPVAYLDIEAGADEFVLLFARREPDGRLAVLAPVVGDEQLLDRAIRKIAP